MLQLSSIAFLLDRFMPNPDLQIRHKIVVRAPAALVLETARTFDLRSTPLVRAIFWLRARILDAKAGAPDWSLGFVQVMLRMGWGRPRRGTQSVVRGRYRVSALDGGCRHDAHPTRPVRRVRRAQIR
jgi:hypothetical protein